MRAFGRDDAGDLSAEFDPVEARVLTRLALDLAESLGEEDPDDPAMKRLLPDAYPGDSEASEEFRRFTSGGIAERKVANAEMMVDDLALAASGDSPTVVRLGSSSVQAWLRSMTDIRLVLASRLGIEQDGDAGRLDDAGLALAEVYDFVGWAQESLLSAMEA